MHGTPYDQIQLNQAMAVAQSSGGSSYYMHPKSGLDPRLVVGGHVLPEVRAWIMSTFHNWMRMNEYADSEKWSTVWIAGSALTRQWRDEGDLDVLVGVSWPQFFQTNSSFRGRPAAEIAKQMNDEMHATLWPTTAEWRGPQGNWLTPFEVTFYVNAIAEDIRVIRPYAAYNLNSDQWDVDPVALPEDWDPDHYVPEAWRTHVNEEIVRARRHLDDVNKLLAGSTTGLAQKTNQTVQIQYQIRQIRDLYEDIHGGRREAFSQFGKGYWDFANYRWQSHKQAGTAKALAAYAKAAK